MLIQGENMGKVKAWEVSDSFWEKASALIPVPARSPDKIYVRKPGAGRPAMDPRKVFEAIVFVLRTGIQWRALPKDVYGSPSAIHAYFQKWHRAGFFTELWRAGLAEYDEMEGIAWEWLGADGSQGTVPLAQDADGSSSTDRGKIRKQGQPAGGRGWRPAIARRARRESP
jgi:transposase